MEKNMNKEIKVSIIIPAYNLEDYLVQCIESIETSKSSSYEVIIVDDGSTDSTPTIIKRFEDKYRNIKAINKENGGVSSARNIGLLNAQGEYIVFVDGDDFLKEKSVDQLIGYLQKNTNDLDVLFLDTMTYDSSGKSELINYGFDKSIFKNGNKKEILKHIATLSKFPGLPHSKVIKKKMLIDNDIVFNESYRNSEDVDWVIAILLNSNSFAYELIKFHYYRIKRTGSLSNTIEPDSIKHMLSLINNWVDRSRKSNYIQYKDIIYNYLSYVYMVIMFNIADLKDHNFVKDVKSYAWILDYATYKSVILTKKFKNIFGFKLACKALKYYRKVKSQ